VSSEQVQQRNAGHEREELRRNLRRLSGNQESDLARFRHHGDDTHGHVDDITASSLPTTIVTMTNPIPRDSNYQPLQENLRRLKSSTDQDGNPFQIIQLPCRRR